MIAARTDDWEAAADRSRKARARGLPASVLACGGGTQQMEVHDDTGVHCDH